MPYCLSSSSTPYWHCCRWGAVRLNAHVTTNCTDHSTPAHLFTHSTDIDSYPPAFPSHAVKSPSLLPSSLSLMTSVVPPPATNRPSVPPPGTFDGTSAPPITNEPPQSDFSRRNLGTWQTSCLGVCCSAPQLCCYAQLCLPCLLYTQRKELMAHHSPPLTDYTCCLDRTGGQYCTQYCHGYCGPFPMNSNNAECCLGTETCCCFFVTVPAHRREIQEQYGTELGKEEWAAHAIACVSWIPVFGWVGGFLISWLAISCYACLAAQQEVEIMAKGAPPLKQTMA